MKREGEAGEGRTAHGVGLKATRKRQKRRIGESVNRSGGLDIGSQRADKGLNRRNGEKPIKHALNSEKKKCLVTRNPKDHVKTKWSPTQKKPVETSGLGSHKKLQSELCPLQGGIYSRPLFRRTWHGKMP
jgi:hypothetical protein